MDVGLDDYITKRKQNIPIRRTGRPTSAKPTKSLSLQNIRQKSTGKVFDAREKLRGFKKTTVQDARQKITAKNKPQRQIVDARQKIKRKKPLDARDKIRKMKPDDQPDQQNKIRVTGLGTVQRGHLTRDNRQQISVSSSGNIFIRKANEGTDIQESTEMDDDFDVPIRMPKIRIQNDQYVPPVKRTKIKPKAEVELEDTTVEEFIPTARPMSERLSARMNPRVNTKSGFKVLVTNLHPVVTEEDIVELFSAIGSLKKAHLLKEGLAEVIFVRKEDALMSITKYHGRELDGVPMQVQLMGQQKESITLKTVETSAPIVEVASMTQAEETSSIGGGGMPLLLGKGRLGHEADVEMNAIHKALFKTKSTVPVKPVNFTVKI